MKKLLAYLALTKPTIQLLVVLTGAVALVFEGSLNDQPWRFALSLIALAMAAGSAKALNQYFERGADARMTRTRSKRPLPQGVISPAQALLFAICLGTASIALFWVFLTPASALLAAATILFYSLFYTLYLKPRTCLSIIIGGLAGGMGPIISWATTASLWEPAPWLMLLPIFFWTPPHFWALAYLHKDDYIKVGYPMLPALVSEQMFWKIVMGYVAATLMASLGLVAAGASVAYALVALLLGGLFLRVVWQAKKSGLPQGARRVFRYSMIYLVALFLALMADRILAS